jgi:N-methylhydantoinase A
MSHNSPSHAETDGNVVIGIDVGGTFTDIVALNIASGRMISTKVPTTPEDQSIGFVNGIAKVAQTMGMAPEAVMQILHGTTVATNAILEKTGEVSALITSEGFRHVLEIGRHDIPRKENMFSWIKPRRPVPPRLIFEVGGRIDVNGSEHRELDEAAIHRIANKLVELRIRSVAICLLHAYKNSDHERRVRDILQEKMPDALISLSSEVLPLFREYERSMATILNSYVMAPVVKYVSRLSDRLEHNSIKSPLLLMNSSGGVMSADTVRREPIQTALSGPAAGALGAAHIGMGCGFPDLISIDIGGTSADVCLIRDGHPSSTMRGRIGDWPLHIPMTDMVTIGAGGGSIARISEGGGLVVGPESAGAQPGPCCYGRGGTEPTVTDAHAVLGRLCDSLVGKELYLDHEAARAAIHSKIAKPLGLTIEQAAEGILEVVNHSMVGAIRLVSIERGIDPRNLALLAFGGAGPLHGSSLVRLLEMKSVIIPPNPGVLSAFGLIVADIRNDFSQSCLERPPHYDLTRIDEAFRYLENMSTSWLNKENVSREAQEISWQASLRYRNQGHELLVPWEGKAVDPAALSQAIESFHLLHEQLYTFAQTDTPVEIVSVHATAIGRTKRPQAVSAQSEAQIRDPIVGSQRIHVDGEWLNCPIYERTALSAGARILGPCIIAQHDTTTVLLPRDVATVHPSGSIIISIEG